MASLILFALSVVVGFDIGLLIAVSMLFAVLGLALGVAALFVISIRQRDTKGYAQAILAIIISIPVVLVICDVSISVSARKKFTENFSGRHNLKILYESLQDYAKAHEGCLPPAESWCDELLRFDEALSRENFQHPLAGDLEQKTYAGYPISSNLELTGDCQFAFNSNLSGKRLDDISKDVVLIFEADGDWNLHGGSELLDTRYIEHNHLHIRFVDGTEVSYHFDQEAYPTYEGRYRRYKKLRWR